MDFNKLSEKIKKQKEEDKIFASLDNKERFKIVFAHLFEMVLFLGIPVDDLNKDKIKKVLIYLIKNLFKYDILRNSTELFNLFYPVIGKYKSENYLKILIVDKNYFKWYIDNIDLRTENDLHMLKNIYKIYYEE